MSIRFNKALRELNIGIQTAVEFLEKKKDLGEVKSDPNFKLSDEQYNALVVAFKQDADVKTQADKLFVKKPKDKKPKETESNRAENLLEKTTHPQFKPLGKIDLNAVGRKPKEATTAEVTADEKATNAAAEGKVVEVEKEAKPEEKPVEVVQKEEKPAKEAPAKEAPVAEKVEQEVKKVEVEKPVESVTGRRAAKGSRGG